MTPIHDRARAMAGSEYSSSSDQDEREDDIEQSEPKVS
jgi:hypothetical protein